MKLPSLSALRAFEAAARHLSMSLAGDELHVTHAAISHQVSNLEEWMGVPLFHRAGRRINLTHPGRLLAVNLNASFESIAEICARVKAMSGGRTLNVGCIPSIASRWLVPNLDKFSALHPGVNIRVVYAKADEKLTDSDLDILITYGEDGSSGVLSVQLFSRINTPVCNPHFLRQFGPFDRPEQIASAPLLHDETTLGWKTWLKLAGVADKGVVAGTVYQDFNLLATAVIAGHGIALCPINVFSAEIRHKDLVILSEISINDDKGYMIMTRKDRPEIARDFVHWFVTTCHSLLL